MKLNQISLKFSHHSRSCTVGGSTQTTTTFSFLDGSTSGIIVQRYFGCVRQTEQVCSVRLNLCSWWNEECQYGMDIYCFNRRLWIRRILWKCECELILCQLCDYAHTTEPIVNECLMRCLRAECSVECWKIKTTETIGFFF